MVMVYKLLLFSVSIFIAANVLPGIRIDGFLKAVLVAAVISLINVIIKPILVVLTLPITVLTLGLFIFVINAVLVLLAGALVSGFEVDGFWWAFLFSIVLAMINFALDKAFN